MSRRRRQYCAVALGVLLAAPGIADAYVGPGLGVGAIAAFFGAVLAVLLAIVGVVWYPLKRLLKRRKAPAESDPGAGGEP
jgi:hypothetical protein